MGARKKGVLKLQNVDSNLQDDQLKLQNDRLKCRIAGDERPYCPTRPHSRKALSGPSDS